MSQHNTHRPWTHTPSRLTLLWLLLSLPLVAWDFGYVFLRPHSMPGGRLHAPLWTPYALYGQVDHIYGEQAYREGNGFTAAQAALNVVETLAYLVYLWIVLGSGRGSGSGEGKGNGKKEVKGRGAPAEAGWLGRAWEVEGRSARVAVLVGFATAVMTLSKTVLYMLNEVFSGFSHIGHNTPYDLLTLWVIPNGMWIIFPSYMTYVFAAEIMEGLDYATDKDVKTQ